MNYKEEIIKTLEEYTSDVNLSDKGDFLTFITIVNLFIDHGLDDETFKLKLKEFCQNTIVNSLNYYDSNSTSHKIFLKNLDDEKSGIYIKSYSENIPSMREFFNDLSPEYQKAFSYQVLCQDSYVGYETRED